LGFGLCLEIDSVAAFYISFLQGFISNVAIFRWFFVSFVNISDVIILDDAILFC
jgi:hypothetical protein